MQHASLLSVCVCTVGCECLCRWQRRGIAIKIVAFIISQRSITVCVTTLFVTLPSLNGLSNHFASDGMP